MHWILLEYKISDQELLSDLKEVFTADEFYFLDETKSNGIPVEVLDYNSYFKKKIDLFIHDEDKGFRYADKLAEHLSNKYDCDSVRELNTKIAVQEFNSELAI